MRREKREELEQLTDRNDLQMAAVVKMKMSLTSIGGGDHVGDIDNTVAREQFVHTRAKAGLGWCLGCRVVHLVRRFLTTPEEFVDFQAAVIDNVGEELRNMSTDPDKLANSPADEQ